LQKLRSSFYFSGSFWFILFFNSLKIPAQGLSSARLDSLYNRFLSYKNIRSEGLQLSSQEDDSAFVKCGFGLVSEVRLNFEFFTPAQKKILTKLLQRPQTDASIVSPSGYFRIHFNTSGLDVPNYDPSLSVEENAMQVAQTADSAFNFEVNYLGYPPPPPENGGGTDNLYDIYISAIRDYGFTQPEDSLGNQKYTSFIVIHYDYKVNFNTKSLDAMRVTIAHEMHHAIQLGNYTGDKIYNDLFFYELTSTSMEEFVFDTVNDYYFYMPSYFRNSGLSFGSNSGYNIAIWNLYMQSKFGFEIIKRQWELFAQPQIRALETIKISIDERSSSFKKELNTFGLWTYFTGKRYARGEEQGFAFEEGAEYPLITPLWEVIFTPHEDIYELPLYPASNTFLRVINGLDTLMILISNSDWNQGIINPELQAGFTYGLYDHFVSGSDTITSNYFKTNQSSDPLVWTTAEILNDAVIIQPIIVNENPASVFPLPYTYGKNGNFIRFMVNKFESTTVDFNVYTIGMELVYSGSMKLDRFDEISSYVISWNPADSKNKRLASGIYLYIIKSGENIQKGKFVVFNK
jgi:hypothetical protein